VNDGCLAHSRQTSALRALAWEWREWCRLHFVTDPETFFGANPRYMLDLLLDEKDGELWRNLNVAQAGAPRSGRRVHIVRSGRGRRVARGALRNRRRRPAGDAAAHRLRL